MLTYQFLRSPRQSSPVLACWLDRDLKPKLDRDPSGAGEVPHRLEERHLKSRFGRPRPIRPEISNSDRLHRYANVNCWLKQGGLKGLQFAPLSRRALWKDTYGPAVRENVSNRARCCHGVFSL